MSIMLILRALTGELRGQEFILTNPSQAILGRSRTCTLRLPGDATVSRQHCLIELDPSGVWVRDLGSLNGTHVNGQNIAQRPAGLIEEVTALTAPRKPLEDGDELRICNNIFAVRLAEIERPDKKVGQTSGEWQLALCV